MFDLEDNTTQKPRFAYTLRSDIPVPAVNTRQKYPFPFMEIGHSFIVPADDPASHRRSGGSCSAASSAYGYGRRHKRKFITRRLPDDGLLVQRAE